MAQSFDELAKRTMTKEQRDRGMRRALELKKEMLLAEVRAVSGKTQRQVAEALKIKQPSLSKLEKQTDMQLSTLRRIVIALGGELEILAKFPKGTVSLQQFTSAT
jgi:predicted XRE-type DNA-binding protein